MIFLDFPSLLNSSNLQAFLRAIRAGESWNDKLDRVHDDLAFQVRYHPTQYPTYFDNFAQYPRIFESLSDGSNRRSSAAGAFQITATTWDDMLSKYSGFGPSFRPWDQMACATSLIHSEGALEDVLEGRFDVALEKCASRWASLPNSPLHDGGRKLSYAKVRAAYEEWGGAFYREEAVITTPQKPAEETPMAAPLALLGPILSVITELIPALGTLFGKNAEKYKDKIGAATQVVDIVTKAVGGANAQDAVEKIQSDPEALKVARAAVVTDPIIGPMLTEVGGGVVAARGWDADPARPRFWLSGAFWMAVLLTPLIYLVTYRVLWGNFSEQLQTVVVTAILSGLLGALTGFFFGAMFNNSRNAQPIVERS